jgi:anti-sigma factor RsiW
MLRKRAEGESADEHTELSRSLPWYVNGTLTTAENGRIQRHLTECESCRTEAAQCRALAGRLPIGAESWKPSAAHFSAILAEVDKLDAATATPRPLKPLASHGLLRRVRLWFAETPGPVRWTLAMETAALAMLIVLAVPRLELISKEHGVFETLSTAEAPAAKAGSLIRLMVADDMTAGEFSVLLRQAQAQVREGPSAVGSYTVEVPASEGPIALASLRAHPKVLLAQPIEQPRNP